MSDEFIEPITKKDIFTGFGTALIYFFATIAVFSVIGEELREFFPFAHAYAQTKNLWTSSVLLAVPPMIVFTILNSISIFFSKNIGYRKGLRLGLLFMLIFIVINLLASYKTRARVENRAASYGISDMEGCMKIQDGPMGKDLRDYDKARCFERVAASTNNPEACDEIVGETEEILGIRNTCYSWVASALKDAVLCRKVSNQTGASDCLFGVAVEAGRPQLCHNLQPEHKKISCYFNAIQKAENPDWYRRFCPLMVASATYSRNCIRFWGAATVESNPDFIDEVDHMQENFEQAIEDLEKSG